MPKEFGRNRRIAQRLKEELSVLVQRAFQLEQYGMITITNVDVSPDLGNAIIYVNLLASHTIDKTDPTAIEQTQKELLLELNEQKGIFRKTLSGLLNSRGVPQLEFRYDESLERAQRLTNIINSVNRNDGENNND